MGKGGQGGGGCAWRGNEKNNAQAEKYLLKKNQDLLYPHPTGNPLIDSIINKSQYPCPGGRGLLTAAHGLSHWLAAYKLM